MNNMVELMESAAQCCASLECCRGIMYLATRVHELYEEEL